MTDFPNFHDGFFEGLLVTDEKRVHFFLRTSDRRRFTLILNGVEAMKLGNVRDGNILFGVVVIRSEELTFSHVADVYDVPLGNGREDRLNHLLAFARTRALVGLELSSSYGAEGVALALSVEIYPDFRFSS